MAVVVLIAWKGGFFESDEAVFWFFLGLSVALPIVAVFLVAKMVGEIVKPSERRDEDA